MSFGWQGTAIALAVGGIAFLVISVVQRFQQTRNMNQHHQSDPFREEQRDINQRNIICPFCKRCVQQNDQRLSCGHHCHKSCYQRRPANNRKCIYCRNLNEEVSASSSPHSQRSNISNDCCYCNNPILSVHVVSKLNCQHSAHQECFNSFKDIMQCQACNSAKYNEL